MPVANAAVAERDVGVAEAVRTPQIGSANVLQLKSIEVTEVALWLHETLGPLMLREPLTVESACARALQAVKARNNAAR
jgi:hypothetical protein